MKEVVFFFFFSGKVQRHLTLVTLWRETGGLGLGEGDIFHFTPFYNFSIFLNVSQVATKYSWVEKSEPCFVFFLHPLWIFFISFKQEYKWEL